MKEGSLTRRPRRAGWCALAVCSLLAAPGAAAAATATATALDFDVWMQHIDRRSQSVFGHLARGDRAASAADARELERLYRLMERYYEAEDNAEDAVISSWEGRERAAQAALAAEQGDFTTAREAVLWIARDCQNCHLKFKPIRGRR